MFAIGSALAMLLFGVGVDLAADDRSAASDVRANDQGDDTNPDTLPAGEDVSEGDAPDEGAATPEEAEKATASAPKSADPIIEARAEAADAAYFDALDTALAGEQDETASAAQDGGQETDFLAFLDGPDGLFEAEEPEELLADVAPEETPEPIVAAEPDAREETIEDDLPGAFDNDLLFGEHSFEDLFAAPMTPELDLEDYKPGDERLVLSYDDDGGSEPTLDVTNEDFGEQRIATVFVDGEVAAHVGLAAGARDLAVADIALVGETVDS